MLGPEPLPLLADGTGLKLRGKGEWLREKHGTATRRSWPALHLGVDARAGQIVASTLTCKDRDGASQVGPLLGQVVGPVASFTGDGGGDLDRVCDGIAERHPETAAVVPPRATAVPSDTAESAPTQRDGYLQHVEPRGSPDMAEHGRMAWQNASGCNKRARVEATMNRWKQVIGDELRAHTDERRTTGGRSPSTRSTACSNWDAQATSAWPDPARGWDRCPRIPDPCTTLAPEAEHVFDWFHITMRLTVLGQYARGVAHHDAAEGARLLAALDSMNGCSGAIISIGPAKRSRSSRTMWK